MKDKKHHYNPLESASFRQSQLATALVSDVSYFVIRELWLIENFFKYLLTLVFSEPKCIVITKDHVVSK